jgi:hypothetical protein
MTAVTPGRGELAREALEKLHKKRALIAQIGKLHCVNDAALIEALTLRLAAKPDDEGVRIKPERLKQIRGLAKSSAEIASDEEAAPTGSMLGIINELLAVLSTTGAPKP